MCSSDLMLFEEGFVCIVRAGHPLAKGPLTLERFLDARHAVIAPRGRPGSVVDNALARRRKTRRVAVAVPHFLMAPELVASSDLVLTVAARVAQHFARYLPLVLLEPPLPLPTFKLQLAWHERQHHDPAQAWFRGVLRELGASVAEEGGRAPVRAKKAMPPARPRR